MSAPIIIEVTCTKCGFTFETGGIDQCPRCGTQIELPEGDIDIDEFLYGKEGA